MFKRIRQRLTASRGWQCLLYAAVIGALLLLVNGLTFRCFLTIGGAHRSLETTFHLGPSAIVWQGDAGRDRIVVGRDGDYAIVEIWRRTALVLWRHNGFYACELDAAEERGYRGLYGGSSAYDKDFSLFTAVCDKRAAACELLYGAGERLPALFVGDGLAVFALPHNASGEPPFLGGGEYLLRASDAAGAPLAEQYY